MPLTVTWLPSDAEHQYDVPLTAVCPVWLPLPSVLTTPVVFHDVVLGGQEEAEYGVIPLAVPVMFE